MLYHEDIGVNDPNTEFRAELEIKKSAIYDASARLNEIYQIRGKRREAVQSHLHDAVCGINQAIFALQNPYNEL
ncbi:hypothetical protein DRN34_02710 [Thermococci archaeon]|nr:MAG: hypothetical protein DRN34_02710 [Thermococci archaeon]